MDHLEAANATSQTMEVLNKAWDKPGRNTTLSEKLRDGTQECHRRIESILNLPGSIASVSGYKKCLTRFYQLYRPLEILLQQFHDWPSIGLDTPCCGMSARLAADLAALDIPVQDLSCAPDTSLPSLPDFGHGLGAAYVLEGSALGSQFILPHLRKLLGHEIVGADSFFYGRGDQTGSYWKQFKASLNLFGQRFPERDLCVVQGAVATFNSIGSWM